MNKLNTKVKQKIREAIGNLNDEDYEKASRAIKFGIDPELVPDWGEGEDEDFFPPHNTDGSPDDTEMPSWMNEAEEEEGEDIEGEEEMDDEGFEDTPAGNSDDILQHLQDALEGARALGDEKLTDQIGNTITFYTREHIVNQEDEPEITPPTPQEGNPVELDESIKRFQKLAGIIKG